MEAIVLVRIVLSRAIELISRHDTIQTPGVQSFGASWHCEVYLLHDTLRGKSNASSKEATKRRDCSSKGQQCSWITCNETTKLHLHLASLSISLPSSNSSVESIQQWRLDSGFLGVQYVLYSEIQGFGISLFWSLPLGHFPLAGVAL